MVQVLTSLNKIAPKGRGIIQNSVTGIGTAAVLQTADSLIGSPLQSFGFVVPFVGIRLSIIDVINYAIHAGGIPGKKKGMTRGFTAVAASKFIQGTLSLGNITALTAGSSSATSTQGPVGGGI